MYDYISYLKIAINPGMYGFMACQISEDAGKQPIDTKKEAGKLAKAIAAPYKAQKTALTGLKQSINKAITKLEQLEATATAKQSKQTVDKKPSVLGQLQKNLAIVEQMKHERPVQERTKSKGAEL